MFILYWKQMMLSVFENAGRLADRSMASRQPSHTSVVTLGEDHRRSQGPDILAIKITRISTNLMAAEAVVLAMKHYEAL